MAFSMGVMQSLTQITNFIVVKKKPLMRKVVKAPSKRSVFVKKVEIEINAWLHANRMKFSGYIGDVVKRLW